MERPQLPLTVCQRGGRWLIAFRNTTLILFDPEVASASAAVQATRALYPGFPIQLED